MTPLIIVPRRYVKGTLLLNIMLSSTIKRILNCWLICCLRLGEIFRYLNHCEEIFVGAVFLPTSIHSFSPSASRHLRDYDFNFQVGPGGFSCRDFHFTTLEPCDFALIESSSCDRLWLILWTDLWARIWVQSYYHKPLDYKQPLKPPEL